MYLPDVNRYEEMQYRRCGRSGIMLPMISLGLWQNFGSANVYDNAKAMLFRAFDLGITHFDLANNYGPMPGSAEENFGRILRDDLLPYRDELIISSKAGHLMWPGPYGDWGSRKYLVASIDQSLKRMGLKYVDIFYHHRPDPNTPLEETMGALDYIVRSGRALYVGISSYSPESTQQAAELLRDLHTPCLIHQPRYNMLYRDFEKNKLFELLDSEGIGAIVFSPLAQGVLSDRYLQNIPPDSRAVRNSSLKQQTITTELKEKICRLNNIALGRQQSLAQMAVAWILRNPSITSALIGASTVAQIENIVGALHNLSFSTDELSLIDNILQ